jgi:hypothetical protein
VPGIKEGIKHERYKWDALWLAFTLVCHDWKAVRYGLLIEVIERKCNRSKGKAALSRTERDRIRVIDFTKSNIGLAMTSCGIEPTPDNYSKLRMACKRAVLEAEASERV